MIFTEWNIFVACLIWLVGWQGTTLLSTLIVPSVVEDREVEIDHLRMFTLWPVALTLLTIWLILQPFRKKDS